MPRPLPRPRLLSSRLRLRPKLLATNSGIVMFLIVTLCFFPTSGPGCLYLVLVSGPGGKIELVFFFLPFFFHTDDQWNWTGKGKGGVG